MDCGKLILLGLVVLGSVQSAASYLPGRPFYPFPSTKKPLRSCPCVKTDIIISLPASERNWASTFERQLVGLMDYFSVSAACYRFGLQLNGLNTETVLSLRDFIDIRQIRTGISLLTRRQVFHPVVGLVGQNYAKALREMSYEFGNYSDDSTRKMVVLFSEGEISQSVVEANAALNISKEMKENGVIVYNLGSSVVQTLPDEFEFTGSNRCTLFGLGQRWSGLPFVIPFLVAAMCGVLDEGVEPKVGEDCFPQFYSFKRPLNFACPPDEYGDFPNPDNCAYYYRCIEGFKEPISQACADGTLFNLFYDPADYMSYCIHWNSKNTCFRYRGLPLKG